MADTFDKVRDGQPLEIAAATWNALLDAGQDHARRKVPGGGGPALDGPLNPAVRVLVKNATGAALAVGSVVALGTPIVSPVTDRREAAATPLFPGTAPASTADAFAVLAEPLEVDEIGRAVLMGVAACDVDVTGATDVYATPKVSDTSQLASAATGPARILWREAGSSGTRKALVLLEGYAPAAEVRQGFYARLTTSSGGKWKWVAITLGLNGSSQLIWQDDGTESSDYTAVPLLTATGVNVAGSSAFPVAVPPYTGMKVRMGPSKYADHYEFEPIIQAFTPFLAVLTSYHSQNRWNFKRARAVTSPAEGGHDDIGEAEVTGGVAYGVAFSPDSPYARFSEVNNVEVGQAVLMWASARLPGTYEFLPQQFASVYSDGLIGVHNQRVPGKKAFYDLWVTNETSPGPAIYFTSRDIHSSDADYQTAPVETLYSRVRMSSSDFFGRLTGVEFYVDNTNWGDSSKEYAIGVDAENGPYVGMRDPDLFGNPFTRYSKGGIVAALSRTGIKMPSVADAAADNGTLYYSTDANKLVFKDSGGTVNNLY